MMPTGRLVGAHLVMVQKTADAQGAEVRSGQTVVETETGGMFSSLIFILISIFYTRCSSRRGDGDSAPNPGNNLHVSGLTTKVQNEDLERVFSTAGRVQRASVMYDPHTRESRGFGFVTMETPEEAEAAINALNATEQWGKIIGVEKVFILSDHDTIEFWTLTQALGQTFSCENSNSREIPWTTEEGGLYVYFITSLFPLYC